LGGGARVGVGGALRLLGGVALGGGELLGGGGARGLRGGELGLERAHPVARRAIALAGRLLDGVGARLGRLRALGGGGDFAFGGAQLLGDGGGFGARRGELALERLQLGFQRLQLRSRRLRSGVGAAGVIVRLRLERAQLFVGGLELGSG